MLTLSTILARLRNTDGLLDEAGGFMLEIIAEGFKLEQDPSGEPWHTLNPEHLAWKRREGFLEEKLRMTDTLRTSMRYKKQGKSVIAGPDGDLPYHIRQHKGGRAYHPGLKKFLNIIPRPYVGFGAAHIESLRDLIIDYYFGD